jgi:parallel beta-helix repeat protein
MSLRNLICTLLVSLSLSPVFAQDEFTRQLQTRLIEAETGDTIRIPAGTFSLKRSLLLDDKKKITILGEGMDKSVLSFKGQIDGAEGIKVNRCLSVSLIGFTIQDAKGDCIKMLNCEDVLLKNVKTEWTGKPSNKNGAYGIYPVNCKKMIIEECTAIGASDAGIYVGQSRNVVVRNCYAYHNVAGIEIENCIGAEVYNNKAYQNTGGILIFDMPELPVKRGGKVKVYNNTIESNNFKNFAPKGNIVGEVPPGTGVMILATPEVEVFNNKIINNRTASFALISFYISGRPWNDNQYNPVSEKIAFYDNVIEKSKKGPSKQNRIGLLVWLKFGKKVPAILYDGILPKTLTRSAAESKNPALLCIWGNTDNSFANLDAGNNFKNITRDVTPHRCDLQK